MKIENKIVIILFITAFTTLFLLYAVLSENPGSGLTVSEEKAVIPTKADLGKEVYVQGTVLDKRMTYSGDNLIVNIECEDKTVLMIFIPKSAGAAAVNREIEPSDYIGVKGTVKEYNKTLEVVPKNENGIFKLKTDENRKKQ